MDSFVFHTCADLVILKSRQRKRKAEKHSLQHLVLKHPR